MAATSGSGTAAGSGVANPMATVHDGPQQPLRHTQQERQDQLQQELQKYIEQQEQLELTALFQHQLEEQRQQQQKEQPHWQHQQQQLEHWTPPSPKRPRRALSSHNIKVNYFDASTATGVEGPSIANGVGGSREADCWPPHPSLLQQIAEMSVVSDEAASIVEAAVTRIHEPHLAAVAGLDLRLLLSQWRKITEENLCRASMVNKKPRFEYF